MSGLIRLPNLLPILALMMGTSAPPARSAEWYVGPTGKEKNRGTRESPWDIATALGGGQAVKPGDTLYLLGGTYRKRPRELFEVRLPGSEGKPIHVRPAPGERPIIDGGLLLAEPCTHVWIRDLEILVSEPLPDKPTQPGSSPADLKRPAGGIHTINNPEQGPTNCKCIHLVIHNTLQGASVWRSARDFEFYGCLVYDNGWQGTDRGHGHGIYTQNDQGLKTLADNIFTGGFDGTYCIHAYGSKKAPVNNYRVEGNICYNCGPLLVGGDRPSHGIRVFDNALYNAPLRVGYGAPYNEDCEVRGNVVVNRDLTIKNYKKAVNEGNFVLATEAKRPKGSRVVLRPSKYDPGRAHLAVFNWEKKPTVAVDVGQLLKEGDAYQLLDPKAFFGKPIQSGVSDGKPLAVPVPGEFAAFVLLKKDRRENDKKRPEPPGR